mgnify:CR=1 FL=1|tara:strand:+ start:274 stop:1005 length:732 start_codon:yes stop_codon:yes gene_type:complete
MNNKFKALLLAAGYGTRLKPHTINKPKCLVDIGGIPLLEYWLKNLEESSCQEVLINTHYLSEQVEAFLEKRPNSQMIIKTSFEKKLLGTAGTLKQNINFFKEDLGVLIHADNFTLLDLKKFVKAHKQRNKKTLLTMVTFLTETPGSCGIVETDNDKILIEFTEKPLNPKSFMANAAIYAFEKKFIQEFIKLENPYDFSKDVIVKFKGKIQTWFTDETLIDIGTPESLKKAQDLAFKQNKKENT